MGKLTENKTNIDNQTRQVTCRFDIVSKENNCKK